MNYYISPVLIFYVLVISLSLTCSSITMGFLSCNAVSWVLLLFNIQNTPLQLPEWNASDLHTYELCAVLPVHCWCNLHSTSAQQRLYLQRKNSR